MTILHWESSIVRCCMYSHCTVFRLCWVKNLQRPCGVGGDEEICRWGWSIFIHMIYTWYSICDLIYIWWSKYKKETLEGFHRKPRKTAGWCQLCKRSQLLSEFCKKLKSRDLFIAGMRLTEKCIFSHQLHSFNWIKWSGGSPSAANGHYGA